MRRFVIWNWCLSYTRTLARLWNLIKTKARVKRTQSVKFPVEHFKFNPSKKSFTNHVRLDGRTDGRKPVSNDYVESSSSRWRGKNGELASHVRYRPRRNSIISRTLTLKTVGPEYGEPLIGHSEVMVCSVCFSIKP